MQVLGVELDFVKNQHLVKDALLGQMVNFVEKNIVNFTKDFQENMLLKI